MDILWAFPSAMFLLRACLKAIGTLGTRYTGQWSTQTKDMEDSAMLFLFEK
jgi:hypothetical protein